MKDSDLDVFSLQAFSRILLCLYIIVKALQKSPKLMLNFTLHSAWQLQSPSFALEYTVSILSNC